MDLCNKHFRRYTVKTYYKVEMWPLATPGPGTVQSAYHQRSRTGRCNASGCRTCVWAHAGPRSLGVCQGGVLLHHMSNNMWLHPKATDSSPHFNDIQDFKWPGDARTLQHLLVFHLVNPDVSSNRISVFNAVVLLPLTPVCNAKPIVCSSVSQTKPAPTIFRTCGLIRQRILRRLQHHPIGSRHANN